MSADFERAREYRQSAVDLLGAADSALDDSIRDELIDLAEHFGRLANALEMGRLAIDCEIIAPK